MAITGFGMEMCIRDRFTPLYIIVFILLPILVMFCQEPLGKLAAHRKDWKPESIGGFIAENFFEMFEVILSYVTNTVSFLRVGAYACLLYTSSIDDVF